MSVDETLMCSFQVSWRIKFTLDFETGRKEAKVCVWRHEYWPSYHTATEAEKGKGYAKDDVVWVVFMCVEYGESNKKK